ncbi:hypothetical protein BBO99_00008796 [Phytophthora kernoviae]|uniref:RING-type E3 ubiquitin transferase n=2 Tax=Phytophthora kernoviae TaxID=325452 RepID=A0A3R7H2U4_9STRA|nr:hypothetical protein G195_009886 [Phytophthora kernoviae 00238/432]KAG2509797.1 hypothetical protein JM16_008647 [Phytophthora kernoviae]KAG2511558.1 hypothetical protein JM18_008568 [Phytophthora kernoviae]RLN11141.1 hypothetical protein BBI17_008817 [Phytophthora kernoviae]RLN74682.1 hypothetical protein BBO99_00008796 [Phytophthora kernoviae]
MWCAWRVAPAQQSPMERGVEAFFAKQYPVAVEQLTLAIQDLPDNTEHVKCFAYLGSKGGEGLAFGGDAEKTLTQMMEVFHCPLSLELMDDPVTTPDGNTYERSMIEQHLEVNGCFDPLTRAPLTKSQLHPNRALKQLMETLLSEHRLGLLLASCSA